MASTIKVDKIEGSTGSTITVPTGQTLTVTDGIPVASGGTGLASFTQGDILYATGATTLVKLAKGTGRQGLQTNSGATAPEWTNSPQSLMTAEGDILYASGANTLAKLAKGSDDEVLTLASGVPSWAAAAGGGAWTWLNNTSISNDSTVDIETGIDSTYPLYAMIFHMVKPVANGESLLFKIKAGGSYQSSNYQYHSTTTHADQTALDFSNANSTSASYIQLISAGVGNSGQTGANISGFFYLPNPSNTVISKNCWWGVSSMESDGVGMFSQGYGFYQDGSAVTGVQFYMGSGNMDSGTISLYGIKNS